jgi:hypothetical protein
MVEADRMEVIKLMKNGDDSFGPGTAIFEEGTFLCCGFVLFYQCPRKANIEAHVWRWRFGSHVHLL